MYQSKNTDLPENDYLSFGEVFTRIWTSPREVLRFIHENEYNKYSIPILLLFGITRALDKTIDKGVELDTPVMPHIIKAVILGGLLGWISLYIYAALMSWMGTWLGGQSTTRQVFRIATYSVIPSICSLFFTILLIIIFGEDLFYDADYTTNAASALIMFFLGVMVLLLSVWSIVLLVIGLSEIQQFSVGKGLLNALLPGIVLLLFIMLMVLLFAF